MTLSPASRGTYGFVGAVLAGCISAAIFSVAWEHAESLLTLIILVVTLPLFIAGLGMGTLGGVIASVAGFVNLIIREPSNYAVSYTLFYSLPALILIALALRYRTDKDETKHWYPEGRLLIAMALYPCALFFMMLALCSNHEGGLLGFTREMFQASFATLSKTMDPESAAQLPGLFDMMTRYLPAMVGVSWTFVVAINMFIGQRMLQQHKWNMRPAPAIRDLRLPGWVINAVIATGLIAIFTNDPYAYVGANLCIMLGVPFLFVGIAIVHSWAQTKDAKTLLLVVFYLALIVMPLFAVVTMLVGVADQWVHFRQRFIKQAKTT